MSEQGSDAALLAIGPLQIFGTIVTSWGIILLLWLLVWLFTRHLEIKPSAVQAAIEGIVSALENAVSNIAPQHARLLMPFIGSLWIFLVIANLTGLIPGLHSPTTDLSATSALACLVFLSVHWFGVRTQGLKNYLRHYLSPSPILLPFHIIGEITRTIALAIRLFGNMMSLEMAALLILMVAGLLVPIPILMLHIIEALVQAYIFGLLALIYIAGGLQAHQIKRQIKDNKEEKNL
ncbi:MAG: F0F1 ATP synthase subunit A [Gammaproteobacteria bacterium]|nr:F0F1 ATP synthase subunit A [Gammaproteobacteria bacterium]